MLTASPAVRLKAKPSSGRPLSPPEVTQALWCMSQGAVRVSGSAPRPRIGLSSRQAGRWAPLPGFILALQAVLRASFH